MQAEWCSKHYHVSECKCIFCLCKFSKPASNFTFLSGLDSPSKRILILASKQLLRPSSKIDSLSGRKYPRTSVNGNFLPHTVYMFFAKIIESFAGTWAHIINGTYTSWRSYGSNKIPYLHYLSKAIRFPKITSLVMCAHAKESQRTLGQIMKRPLLHGTFSNIFLKRVPFST